MADADILDDGPLKHIVRDTLPWRADPRTECGRPLSDVAALLTRDEAAVLWKRHGAKRASFLLCVTCVDTANRHRSFDEDPCSAANRAYPNWRATDEMQRELRAIALLIAAHQDEFDQLMVGLAEAPSLDKRRAARRHRPLPRGGL